MKYILTLLSLCFSVILSGQCLDDWSYAREVTINNTQGIDYENIAVRINLNTGQLVTAGKLNSDGSDLRFTDENCNLLNYFADSLATNNDNVVWVNVPSLPANSATTIFAYYGNTDATPYASGENTFAFFDDFESGVIDTDKWEAVGSFDTFEIVDGVLNYASDAFIYDDSRFKFVQTKAAFLDKMIYEFKAQISNSNGFGFSSNADPINRILFRQSSFGFDTLSQIAYMTDTLSNGFATGETYPIIRFPRNEMNDGVIVAEVDDSDHMMISHFASLTEQSANNSPYSISDPFTPAGGAHFIISSFASAFPIYLDYLRIRKFSPPNAFDVMAGMEMNNGTTSLKEIGLLPSLEIYPNPTAGEVWLDTGENQNFLLELIDPQGKRLQTTSFVQSTRVDLENQAPGTYWVLIRDAATGQKMYEGALVRVK
jgi:hypothetical protein